MVRALLFIHQADREARKASDVSTAKYDIPSRVLSRLFATPQYFNSICTNGQCNQIKQFLENHFPPCRYST